MKKLYLSFLLICFLSGAGMYTYSFQYPWYRPDGSWGEISSRLADMPPDERWSEWYIELKKIETPRKMLHDTGVGLMSLSGILLAFYLSYGFPLKHARTPGKRWVFILIYWLAIAVQIPLSRYLLMHKLRRGDFPTWGDTIIIGIAQTTILCYMFAGIGLILFIPILLKVRLPANLFIWPKANPVANAFFTAVFVFPVLLSLWFLPSEITRGSIGGVIMATTLIYLFMSARAANLNYWMENDRQGDVEPTVPAAPAEKRSDHETSNPYDNVGRQGSG